MSGHNPGPPLPATDMILDWFARTWFHEESISATYRTSSITMFRKISELTSIGWAVLPVLDAAVMHGRWRRTRRYGGISPARLSPILRYVIVQVRHFKLMMKAHNGWDKLKNVKIDDDGIAQLQPHYQVCPPPHGVVTEQLIMMCRSHSRS